jgi:hypothetical protein
VPCFLVPLHEYNDCHAPAGSPAGGQFCADEDLAGPGPDDYQQGYPEAQASAMASARSALLRASFESDAVRETMSVVDGRGVYVGEMLVGEDDEIEIPDTVWRAWIAKGPVVTAHTHPGSSTFSFGDFRFHNTVNRAGVAERPRWPVVLAVPAMQVFGDDGSWYEIKFGKVMTHPELTSMEKSFDRKLNLVKNFADAATDRWAKEQSWWANRPPKTWDLMTERGHIRHAAEKAGQLKTLDAYYERQFRDQAKDIWTGLAAQYGFTYRYHLTD